MTLTARVIRPSRRAELVSRLAWYPTLLVVAFLIHPLSERDVPLSDAVRPLAAGVMLALTITVVLTLLVGRDRGAALALLVVMALLVATTPTRVALFVVAIVLALTVIVADRAGRLQVRIPWASLTHALTLLTIVLIAIEIAAAGLLRVTEPAVAAPAGWRSPANGSRPDIFMILADGHGRSDVLQADFNLNNNAFRARLNSLGFVEAIDSHANHMTTLYSLSVLLNGRPLSELGQDMEAPANPEIPPAALRANSVFGLVQAAGYRVMALDSGYSEVHLSSADDVVDVGPRNELERTILAETALGLVADGGPEANIAAQGERTLREFAALQRLAAGSTTGPLFVFAHVPSPHVPYVLNARCELDPNVDLTADPLAVGTDVPVSLSVAAQRDQTACIDQLLVRTARAIVDARPDAIVILFSDHGPGELLSPTLPDEPGAGDRMANMFWARTPGLGSPFPVDISLVNVFPILFDRLWNMHLPQHPNDIYLGPTTPGNRFIHYVPDAVDGSDSAQLATTGTNR